MYTYKESRSKFGKEMDNYLRENIQDKEILWSLWETLGIPDGATEKDYDDLENDEFWTDVCESFMRCILLDAKNHQ